MNSVAEEILMHYGMPRRSGRYPYGSGKDPYQHGNRDLMGRIEELRKQNFTYYDENTGKTYTGDTAIAKELGLSTTQLRTEIAIAKEERRAYLNARIESLKSDGLNTTEIGRELGLPESTVRSIMKSKTDLKTKQARETADFLKARLEEVRENGGMLDVGAGIERELNISKEKLNQALYLLEREGYPVYGGRIEQVTNRGQFTTQKVLCLPGTDHKEIYNLDKISTVNEYMSRDGGQTFEKKFQYPSSMDSNRLYIRYNEDGGLERDGLVEIRRGVDDLSLGNSHYAQVRILVDDTHYIKGMAVYSDGADMPNGVDVIFNTNKKRGTAMTDVLKPITNDPDNPFGSLIKDADKGGQYKYIDKDGKEKLGLINKRSDEGDWSDWKDALPSQFLAKQPISLIKKQLGLAKADKQAEYEEICSLTNPTIKKHLLNKFADGCDSAAVHLQAAALPGQKYHVMIPINSLKDNEVYAPRYENGTQLALVRYPHAGLFEIPIVTVNNKHAKAKKLLDPKIEDAIGVNKKVADQLSGADFDGDTVMCIPTNNGKVRIANRPGLKGLEGFDPKDQYGPSSYEGKNVKLMTKKGTSLQMGVISNLITDMTLGGANETELAAAVRHSMVVIDAAKHKLNYKQSEIDNNIAALHEKYQGKATGGAATILSKAKGQESVPKTKGSPKINEKGKSWYDPSKPEGSLIYTLDPDRFYTVTKTNKKTGEVTTRVEERMQKSTKMRETDDANTLVSTAKHPKELEYASYANSMKAMANQARMEILRTGNQKMDKTAKEVYKEEVASLNTKLNNAELNKGRERAALRKANVAVETKKKEREEAGNKMDKSEVKKASQQAMSKYRQEVGSVSRRERNINITDREWEAIQAGAVSENTLKRILNNADIDKLRERATPRSTTTMTPARISRIKTLAASGLTLAQIASALGVSPSTVSNYLKKE